MSWLIADETIEIDIDVDDLIDMIVTSFWDAIDQVVDSLAEVAWSFIPDASGSIFGSATLPLVLIILMILPIKIMLDRVRNA